MSLKVVLWDKGNPRFKLNIRLPFFFIYFLYFLHFGVTQSLKAKSKLERKGLHTSM